MPNCRINFPLRRSFLCALLLTAAWPACAEDNGGQNLAAPPFAAPTANDEPVPLTAPPPPPPTLSAPADALPASPPVPPPPPATSSVLVPPPVAPAASILSLPPPSPPPSAPLPPAADLTPVSADIQAQVLPAPNPDSIGFLDQASGGLGKDLWKHSNYADVAQLMQAMPSFYASGVLRDLAHRLLVTIADAPWGDVPPRTLNSLRLEELARLDDWADADRFLTLAQRHGIDDRAMAAWANAGLMTADDNTITKVCTTTTLQQQSAATVFWSELATYCKLRANDMRGAGLTLELLREQAGGDTGFTQLAAYALGQTEVPREKDLEDDTIDGVAVAMLSYVHKLDLERISGHIGSPYPDLLIARSDGGITSQGVGAAEWSLSAGSLSTEELAAIYNKAPAAKEKLQASDALMRANLYRNAMAEKDPVRRIAAISAFLKSALPVYPDLAGPWGAFVLTMVGNVQPTAAMGARDSAMIALVYLAQAKPDVAATWLGLAAADKKALMALRPLMLLENLADPIPAWSMEAGAIDEATLTSQAEAMALLDLFNIRNAKIPLADAPRLARHITSPPSLAGWRSRRIADALGRGAKGEALLLLLLDSAAPDYAEDGVDTTVWAGDIAQALLALDYKTEARMLAVETLAHRALFTLAASP